MKNVLGLILILLISTPTALACNDDYDTPTKGFLIDSVKTISVPGYFQLTLTGLYMVSNEIYLDTYNNSIVGPEGIRGQQESPGISSFPESEHYSVNVTDNGSLFFALQYNDTTTYNVSLIPHRNSFNQSESFAFHSFFTVFYSPRYQSYYIFFGKTLFEVAIFNINSKQIIQQDSPSIYTIGISVYDTKGILKVRTWDGCKTYLLYNNSAVWTPLLSSGTWDARISLLVDINQVFSNSTDIDHYLVQEYNYSSHFYENYTLSEDVFDKYITGPENYSILPYILVAILLITISGLLIYKYRDEND